MRIWVLISILILVLVVFNLIYVRIKFKYDLRYTQEEKSLTVVFVPIIQRFMWEKKMVAPGEASEWIDLIAAILNKKSDKSKTKNKAEELKRKAPNSVKLKLAFRDYYKLFRAFMSHLVLERFEWKTCLGLDDAMHTALACGGIWAFKGNMLALVSHFSSLEEVELGVEPVYNQSGFTSQLDSIMKIRIVYIMLIICYASFISIRGYINGRTARKAQPSY